MNMMHVGGKHRNKKNRAEKKTAASPENQEPVRGQQEHEEKVIRQQEPRNDKSLSSRKSAEDEVIRPCEETEETLKIIADLAKRSYSDLEQV